MLTIVWVSLQLLIEDIELGEVRQKCDTSLVPSPSFPLSTTPPNSLSLLRTQLLDNLMGLRTLASSFVLSSSLWTTVIKCLALYWCFFICPLKRRERTIFGRGRRHVSQPLCAFNFPASFSSLLQPSCLKQLFSCSASCPVWLQRLRCKHCPCGSDPNLWQRRVSLYGLSFLCYPCTAASLGIMHINQTFAWGFEVNKIAACRLKCRDYYCCSQMFKQERQRST